MMKSAIKNSEGRAKRQRNRLLRATISFCLIAALLLSFSACSSKKNAMKLGKASISEGEYAYYLSCYKSYWLYTFGGADTDEFWNTEYDFGSAGKVTAFDYLTAQTNDAIKAKLAACYLFDEYKLKLTDAMIQEADNIIAGILEGAGGEQEFLKDDLTVKLGVTIDDIRNTYLADAKSALVQNYLYGELGTETVTSEEKNNFYKNNYFRFRHIYLMNVDIVYDEDGNKQYKDTGELLTKEISEERWKEKCALANELCERIKAGEDMNRLITEYSEENNPLKNYPNGHYLTVPNSYFAGLSNAVTGMDIGDITVAESEGGIHVIERLPLDEGAYQSSENANCFTNFTALVTEYKYKRKLQECYDKIKIDSEITEKYNLRTIPYTSSWIGAF